MNISEEKIVLIGIGGGGSNAVDYIYKNTEFKDAFKFININTDKQVLELSVVPNKIQIGKNITNGLGSGGDAQVGEYCAKENVEEIKKALIGSKKVVLISCFGGGTGTGATPVVAKCARDLGIRTINIITTPFKFEGNRRILTAQIGLEVLEDYTGIKYVINGQDILDTLSNNPDRRLKELFDTFGERIYERVKLLLMI